jgi:hypothetical protein
MHAADSVAPPHIVREECDWGVGEAGSAIQGLPLRIGRGSQRRRVGPKQVPRVQDGRWD